MKGFTRGHPAHGIHIPKSPQGRCSIPPPANPETCRLDRAWGTHGERRHHPCHPEAHRPSPGSEVSQVWTSPRGSRGIWEGFLEEGTSCQALKKEEGRAAGQDLLGTENSMGTCRSGLDSFLVWGCWCPVPHLFHGAADSCPRSVTGSCQLPLRY